MCILGASFSKVLHKLPLVLFSCVGHLRGSVVPGIPGSVPFPLHHCYPNTCIILIPPPTLLLSVGLSGNRGLSDQFWEFTKVWLLWPQALWGVPCTTLLLPIVGFYILSSDKNVLLSLTSCWYHADCVTVGSLTSPVYILNSCRYLAHSFVVLSMGL